MIGRDADPTVLHAVVVYHPGYADPSDSRKVGPAQVYELAEFLTALGLPVVTAEREYEPERRPSENGGDPDRHEQVIDNYLPEPETVQLVLQWAGEQFASGIIGAAGGHLTAAWIAERRGRKQSRKADRRRCIAWARFQLLVEYGVDLDGAEPVEEAQDTDGAWTITFGVADYEVWARVPIDVDDLRNPGAVRTGRRKLSLSN